MTNPNHLKFLAVLPDWTPLKIMWVDSQVTRDWVLVEDSKIDHLELCTSVGLFMHYTNDLVQLALNYDPEGKSVNCTVTIPMCAVFSLEKLVGEKGDK